MKFLHHSSLDQLIEVILLGIDIDIRLNFNNHISNICKKAAQQLNVLKRIENCLSRLNKLSIFSYFYPMQFQFLPTSWHICSEVNTQKKDRKSSKQAFRFVYEDFNSFYEDRLPKKLVCQVYILEE